jgi:hypothetical protein
VAWRAKKKAAGRAAAGAGRGVTRGTAGKQEVARGCYGSEQRREARLGQMAGDVARRGKASAGSGKSVARQGRARG